MSRQVLLREQRWFQRSVVVICFALWLLAFVNPERKWIGVTVTALTIWLWSWVALYKVFRKNLMVRRALKFLPYVMPLPYFGADLGVNPLALSVALVFAAVWVGIGWRDTKVALNPALLSLMPRTTRDDRWSETLFYSGAAICQEYVHRYVFVVYLMSVNVPSYLIVLITTATFVGEHFTGPGTHTSATRSNVILWTTMGMVLGAAAVYLQPALVAITIAHLIINFPASLRPHLRGKPARGERNR